MGAAPEVDLSLRVVDGQLPTDLHGHAFIAGPRPRAGEPLLSGDGMLWRLDLDAAGPAGVPLRSRAVRTWDAEEDRSAPRRFRTRGLARMSLRSGIRSLVNTAVLPISDGRLLATCDVGRPWEIDPVTLEAVTPIGYYAEWLWSLLHPKNPLVLTNAHPAHDPHTGAVWFAETQSESTVVDMLRDRERRDLHITCWDGRGPLRRWRVRGKQIIRSAHQVVLTADYLIVADTAFAVEFRQLLGQRHAVAHPPHGDLHIIRRADLTSARVGQRVSSIHVRLPINVVHFAADWENPGGRITLHVAGLGPNDASEWLRHDDRLVHSGEPVRRDLVGHFPSFHDVAPLGRFVIDGHRGQILEQEVLADPDRLWAPVFMATNEAHAAAGRPIGSIFYNDAGLVPDLLIQRIVELYRDFPRRVPVDELAHRRRTPQLVRVQTSPLALADAYAMPDASAVTSPVFLPRRGHHGELDGYVAAVVIREESSEIWLFDAHDLARGPVCRLGHPDLTMPLTLHTAWMPEIGPRQVDYRVERERDAVSSLARLPRKAVELVRALLDD